MRRRNALVFLLGIMILALTTPAHAETCFTAIIDGAQSGTGSTATGIGFFILNDAQTELTYNITFSGLGSAETAAHIHNENEGGGVVKNLGTGDPKVGLWTSVEASPLNAARLADLLAGRMYVNIHSTNFPGGEIRGQILVGGCNETCFESPIDGVQSGTGSLATGVGKYSLNHTQTELQYKIEFSGLGSPEVAAHIHNTNEGGGVVKDLGTGTPKTGSWRFDDASPLTPARVADLFAGALYTNIHSQNFPAGEIRGSLVQSPTCGTCYVGLIDGVQSGTGSNGAGFAYALLNHVEDELAYQVTFAQLSSAEVAAHIHNDNEGGAVVKNIGLGMSKSGVWTGSDVPPLTLARVNDLKAGMMYVNIHSTNFPPGEIRGQLLPGNCNPTGIGDRPVVVSSLSQNYPNPFNPSTSIRFSLSEQVTVRLEIYDVAGRRVASLVNDVRGPGISVVEWNGLDGVGRQVSSGIYFYRLVAGNYVQTRKMVLLK